MGFFEIQPVEFKRVISNLVNNAAEVLGNHGRVEVTLSKHDDTVLISVSDNGKGIPPELLKKLGQRGETHGKAGGSGLGLYHARTSVESWGGTFKIESEVGKGTAIKVFLPIAESPAWFVADLKFTPNSYIVCVDDDDSIP